MNLLIMGKVVATKMWVDYRLFGIGWCMVDALVYGAGWCMVDLPVYGTC
jgi:hypothetical protein